MFQSNVIRFAENFKSGRKSRLAFSSSRIGFHLQRYTSRLTGFQPYQLMFGHHAPAPCDNWLGLCAYNDDKSITHMDWVDQQLEQLLHANKHAQKNIKATNAKNHKVMGGKDLVIPVGNLVLHRNHPEGCNKIQDSNKDQIYVVTLHHVHQNAYFIKPLGSKCQPKQVN